MKQQLYIMKKNSSIVTKRIIHRSDFFKSPFFCLVFSPKSNQPYLFCWALAVKLITALSLAHFFFFLTYLWCHGRYPATLRFVTPGYKIRIVFHIFRIQKHVNPWQFYNSQLYLSSHVICITWLLYECVKIQCVLSKKGENNNKGAKEEFHVSSFFFFSMCVLIYIFSL